METVNGATVVLGDTSAAEPSVVGPQVTGGGYVAMIGGIPPDKTPPPFHTHPDTDEGFYIASGELTFKIGDREVMGGAGTFVFIPRGVPHTAWNSGAEPMHGIIVISPGHAEHVFEPVGDKIPGPTAGT